MSATGGTAGYYDVLLLGHANYRSRIKTQVELGWIIYVCCNNNDQLNVTEALTLTHLIITLLLVQLWISYGNHDNLGTVHRGDTMGELEAKIIDLNGCLGWRIYLF